MGWFNTKVVVTLIDDANGEVMGLSKMSPGDLPDTFSIETKLAIGNDNWVVVRADPVNKADFIKSGKLSIRLSKIVIMDPSDINFSQVDITERFYDNQALSREIWIETMPLNAKIPSPESRGLPSVNATNDEVYRIAADLSVLRESLAIPNDGVYCPICHIANIDINKLHLPCPKCGRFLLKFGWT